MKTPMMKLIDCLDPIHSGIKSIAEELLKDEAQMIIDAVLHGTEMLHDTGGLENLDAAVDYYNMRFGNNKENT